MRLTAKEAAQARERRLEYEANMAIEGIVLTPEERRVFDEIDALRMGHEEALDYVIQWCRDEGLIPDDTGK